jgi:type I restriction enzyme M protein
MPLPANFEKSLWAAADQLWTNSALQPSEYSTPVLALIFLEFADTRFAQAEKRFSEMYRSLCPPVRFRTSGEHRWTSP